MDFYEIIDEIKSGLKDLKDEELGHFEEGTPEYENIKDDYDSMLNELQNLENANSVDELIDFIKKHRLVFVFADLYSQLQNFINNNYLER